MATIRTQEVSKDVTTNGLPEGDSAHGGVLEGFGLTADKLKLLGKIECDQRWHGFGPTGSAIAVEGKDPFDDLHADVGSYRSGLDELECASQNEKHTLMTKELGTWILDRLVR